MLIVAQCFQIHLKHLHAPGVDVAELSRQTEGYSGADIAAICQEAALQALRNDLDAACISQGNLLDACKAISPSLGDDASKSLLRAFDRLQITI